MISSSSPDVLRLYLKIPPPLQMMDSDRIELIMIHMYMYMSVYICTHMYIWICVYIKCFCLSCFMVMCLVLFKIFCIVSEEGTQLPKHVVMMVPINIILLIVCYLTTLNWNWNRGVELESCEIPTIF